MRTATTTGVLRRSAKLLAVVCIALTASACTALDAIGNADSQGAGILSQLQADLDANSMEWHQLIDHAISSMPKTLTDAIKGLQDTVDEGINAAGKMAMCSEAYVGKSLIHAVGVVRAQLLKQPLPLAHPMVCNTTPASVDPSNLVLNPQTVVYTGFYLESGTKALFLVDRNGSKTDVTASLRTRDAFSDTVDVGGANGVKAGSSTARLDLVNDSGTYSVTFNPPGLPACVAHTELMDTPPGSFTLHAQHSGGDLDYYGHGPNILISEYTLVGRTNVTANLSLTATEDGGDQSQASGSESYIAYRAPAGYTIMSIESATLSDSVSYRHTGGSLESPIDRGTTSLVRYYQVSVPNAGNTEVTVAFNLLKVRLFGPPAGASACSDPLPLPPTPPQPGPKPTPTPIDPPHPCKVITKMLSSLPKDGGGCES